MENIVLNLPITPVHMWVVFLLAVLFFIVISIMLVFHWTYYGVQENPRVFARSLYFVISIGIIVVALLLLSLYSAT